MRGKIQVESGCHRPPGITPACAGKRNQHDPYYIMIRDHPRVCGEKAVKVKQVLTLLGSPPRVRGKVDGSTDSHALIGDHPCVCGEKAVMAG